MIGRFARLAGVSVHALRHYDEVGLLVPADVDPATGWRRYRWEQLHDARLIQALRWVDLPIEDVRRILAHEDAHQVLARHRDELERQRSQVVARIADVDRFLEKGIAMPTVQSGTRPVQIRLAVDDPSAAVEFYQEAFGLRYEVARRTRTGDHSTFMFGEYGRDDFFLLWLLGPDRCDRPGPARFSLLVEDLDACHARALAAGATEVAAPFDAEGMPRSSAVQDPSGNRIGLAQGWPSFRAGARPVQIMLAVDDPSAAVDFYQEAFDFRYEVARRTTNGDHSGFIFGEYGRDDFFLLWLLGPERSDRPGRSNFSLLVEDLDAYHARALAAGATELAAPFDAEGMPRSSAIEDPSGNRIGLAQG